MPALLEGLAGLLLVCAVLSDVFRSVVLPRATRRTLRVGPTLGLLMLRAWLAWTERRPARRHATLGALGPLLLVCEMLIWVALLVLGYGTMLHATHGTRPGDTFGGALYAAASAFITVGLSGQEAATGPARMVIAATGLSGLAVVTLVVTFLLSVQGALLRRETLVLRLRERTGPRPSGVAVLLAHARLGREDDAALRSFFREWDEWAADVLLTHRAYPILAYFRSTDEDCEWLAALGAVLDAAALAAVLRHDGTVEHAMLCHRIGARLLADLARQFGLKARFAPDLDEAAFQDALVRLREAGYGPKGEAEAAWREFAELRSAHHPPLRALVARFGAQAPGW